MVEKNDLTWFAPNKWMMLFSSLNRKSSIKRNYFLDCLLVYLDIWKTCINGSKMTKIDINTNVDLFTIIVFNQIILRSFCTIYEADVLVSIWTMPLVCLVLKVGSSWYLWDHECRHDTTIQIYLSRAGSIAM